MEIYWSAQDWAWGLSLIGLTIAMHAMGVVITYKLHERAYGGLSLATARKLEHANADPQSRGACPYRKLYPTGAKPRITRCLRRAYEIRLTRFDG
jgi:hypothetical protein